MRWMAAVLSVAAIVLLGAALLRSRSVEPRDVHPTLEQVRPTSLSPSTGAWPDAVAPLDDDPGSDRSGDVAATIERAPVELDPTPAQAISASATRASRWSRASLVGHVVDRSGAALPGATFSRRGSSTCVASDANGRFEMTINVLTRLGPRERDFEVDAAGFATHRLEAVLAPGETRDVGTIVLQRLATLSGRVVDPNRNPITGVRVRAVWPNEPSSTGRTERSILSDERGEFEFADVAPGTIELYAAVEGRHRARRVTVELGFGDRALAQDLVLAPFAAEELVRLIVLEPDGSPCAGAELDYFGANVHGIAPRSTDRDGVALIPILDDREVHVAASVADQRFGAALTVLRRQQEATMIRLAMPRRLTVEVFDGSGAPLPRFRVHVLHPHAHVPIAAPIVREPDRPGDPTTVVGDAIFELSVVVDRATHFRSGPFDPRTCGPRIVLTAPE